MTYRDIFADILIVAEKPSVAEAFARALAGRNYSSFKIRGVKLFKFKLNGENCISIGLKGHIFNYDFEEKYNSWRAVDPRMLFFINPIRVIEPTSTRYLEVLKAVSRYAKTVYLALDADVEGESIAFEVMDVVRSVNPYAEFKRLWFNSTVEEELRKAIKKPVEPNKLLADKCSARMIIDLTIGAAFTRLITRAIEKKNPRALPLGHFLSYGPCQSPTLFLVVQRAWEREKFKPETYYTIKAKVEIYGGIYTAECTIGKIKNEQEAKEIYNKIKNIRVAKVKDYKVTRKTRKPPIPLTTLELESRASKYLNIRAKQTLDLAEELYRLGYISYPRTETEIYPKTLNLAKILTMLTQNPEHGSYAEKLLSTRIKPTKGTRDDKAHPPIHPTKPATKNELQNKLGRKAWKLYDLIVRHFLATLSSPAKVENRRILIDIGGINFTVRGTIIIEEGYFEVYPFERVEEEFLPDVKAGEHLEVVEVKLIEGKTNPPPFLSEAELLKLMDKYGIGTDATKQDHIHTNIKRGYFYIKDKKCIPTPLGKTLIEVLYEIVPEVVKPEVRGFMEKMLSEIAVGKRSKSEVVSLAKKYFLKQFDILRKYEDKLAEKIVPSIRESLELVKKSAKLRKSRRKTR